MFYSRRAVQPERNLLAHNYLLQEDFRLLSSGAPLLGLKRKALLILLLKRNYPENIGFGIVTLKQDFQGAWPLLKSLREVRLFALFFAASGYTWRKK